MVRLSPILCAAAVLVATPAVCAPAGPAAESAPAAGPAATPIPGPGRTPPATRATRIPEPDTIALFLMCAAGLLVGRRLSRSRRRAPDA